MKTILVTGGAGFIGRHVCNLLVESGYSVRALDGLIEQVHRLPMTRLSVPDVVDFIEGDIRNPSTMKKALKGIDGVIHLAAEVGVGQSMYAVDRYVSVNDHGTAVLFQQLLERPVERVVVASSMSIYGEGLYTSKDGKYVEDAARAQARNASWDPLDSNGSPLIPVATPEWKRPALASVYALTKFVQEQLTLMLCEAYGMEGVALRLFNTYGPGQALSNPYTGVLAIFASRLLNGKPPHLFEDGNQRRDFIHVSDVARAFVMALGHRAAPGNVYNIGSGHERSVRDVAQALAEAMGCENVTPVVTNRARAGDIRHCFADISKAQTELGFYPERDFDEGLAQLATWVAQQKVVDRAEEAHQEMEARGLVT
jgi:dTDP-L-rhamnose 4-epimerase